METKKPVIYVGCSLTHASEEFKNEVEDFKKKLGAAGYEVMEFLGLVAGTPEDVYGEDIEKNVGSCDAFIGICDHPSIGLGYEMAVAAEKRKIPTLALAHKDSKVTRLVKGVTLKNYAFKTYSDKEEMLKIAKEFLRGGL